MLRLPLYFQNCLQVGMRCSTVCFSLTKCVMWTKNALTSAQSYRNVLRDQDECLSPETHTYLFLQAFLHFALQAVLQIHLLIVGAAKDSFTGRLMLYFN